MLLPGDMIKRHNTAKLQQTKLLGIRGKEKVNEKKKEGVRVTKKIKEKQERKQGRNHIRENKLL